MKHDVETKIESEGAVETVEGLTAGEKGVNSADTQSVSPMEETDQAEPRKLCQEEHETDETAECDTGAIPHGTESKAGTKVLQIPDLVSMWKYILNPNYANRRLAFYTYLNSCLRDGTLSSIVGFQVLNRVINKEACILKGVTFWDIDRESFYADVEVELHLLSHTGPQTWKGIMICWCSFDEEFSLYVEGLRKSIDRKADGYTMLSPFLTPYMTNKQMDAFAEKVWIDCGLKDAIKDPKLRDAAKLAKRLGLSIMYLDVYEHQNMDSMIFFSDSDLLVGEDRVEKQEDGTEITIKADNPETVRIPADTIVVNTNRIRRDYSAFNIFHECIHYLLHYKFFRLQEMGSNDIRLVKTKEMEVEEGKELSDPIYFMEKQANRGAYGLMMPASDTHERIRTECGKVKSYSNEGEKFEKVGKALGAQLRLPHFRIKPRMIQLGYIEAKGALNYDEFRKLYRPFAFDVDSWRASDVTFVVKQSTSNGLYRTNESFRAVIDSGKYVYADGHIVRNEPRFVKKEGNNLFLTEEAARRVDDCCLRFVRNYVQANVGQYYLGRMFYDPHYVERTQFFIQDIINEKQMDELDAKIEYRDTFPRTFIKAFDQVMEQNNETRETVAYRLHTSTDTLQRWLMNPEQKISLDFIVRIVLMWQLPDWVSKLLLDRAMIRVSEYDRRHQALEYIRTVLWDQGIEEANKYLASKGLDLLESYETEQTEFRKRKSKAN